MGQNSFLISLALISIFVLAFINMAIGYGIDNETNINIGDSDFVGEMNNTILTNAREGFSVQNDSGTSFEESSIEESSESGTLVTGSVFKTASNADKKTVFNIIGNAQRALFGNDAGFNAIFMMIGTVVGFIGLSLIWKTWKGANPE